MDSLALSCLILLSLPLLPFLSAANIPLGSTLSSTSNNSSWISPSRDFAFGFRQLNNNSDLFLLAIWFNKMPERTIIWHANEDNHPVLAPRGSTLELTATGLLLKDPGGQAIWDEKPNKISFKSPTDTILPTQIFDLGSVLVSRLTETNLSKGRFELHFSNGSLQLIPVAWPTPSQYKKYAYPKNSAPNQSWFTIQRLPNNICTSISDEFGSGACGFNSYCLLQNGRPFCECPPEYLFVDPTNRFSGCKPNYWQGCGPDDGSRNAEELLEPYNQTECETSCLHDCLCAVAIYNNGRQCWKTGFTKALIKVRKGGFRVDFDGNTGGKKGIPILRGALLLGSSVFFNGLLLLAISLLVFVWRKRKDGNKVQRSSISETNLRFFSLVELNEATNGFEEELGRGSFGIVYKGVFKSASGNAVAVKKLDELAQEREREFKTEVSAIGRTHHKNHVQLLGFCDEGLNRLLVYEFMGIGTLANLLFASPRPDWSLRVRISLEIARGLLYLHGECNVPIIHCDIKPQNILLDQDFTAKISDFGLSKLLLSDQSRTRTMIRGTRGYVAPEWFKNVPVSAKVDVYSFGVVLLKIICCKRSVEMELGEERSAILTDWAYDCYVEGKLDVLVDNDKAAMADKSRACKWLMIALWCIQEDPLKRPAMKMIVQMLEGYLEVPSPPMPPLHSLQLTES
ncbi:G-type lectin S-receptor-like serine/threonine-protein kinase LECRK4 [Citrus sinensis]|uniref:G-type lectin S-receptor-like serine/threonine-protein kinase LECRK4 n=1 Tax=Citrus sinensis TaxID=2711 RepID=A0ACB8LUT4_CITSI|nr:G-type lectin S-receptor-like serine/threonine-protein kinase LECRK4 [Citrus sinensis]